MDITSQFQRERVTKIENEVETLYEKHLINVHLKMENEQLQYQLHHLEKAKLHYEQQYNDYSNSTINSLEAIFDLAIKQAYRSIPDANVELTICSNLKFGDYQCNSAMGISKKLSLVGDKCSPRDVAARIVDNIAPSSVIEKCEIAGAGFINIFLKKEFVAEEICKIIRSGVLPPKYHSQRMVIDYSSPNIAKEMHVGHLRSTIIGDCLARLFRFLGCDVVALNHIGDWGTQFGMLITHLQDKFPDYVTESPPIADLQAFYKESKKRFDEDSEFKERAYKAVVSLQGNDEDSRKAWSLICDVSRREFEKIYVRLGVTDLIERGESFYQQKMVDMVANLEKLQLLTEHDGTKRLLGGDNETDIYMLMVKSDGGFTYDTSDMAALHQRLTEERAETVIYVVDSGQSSHFDGLFLAARRAGFYDPKRHRVEHVGFGVVLGSDGRKFKSRANETVRLSELLDEGLSRSMAKLKDRGRDKELSEEEMRNAQEAVAYGCIKYADLSHHRVKEYTFSFDKMLEDKGNTAVYLLYAYTRISGISRSAKLSLDDLRLYLSKNSLALAIEHPAEWRLAKAIARFPEVLLKMAADLLPHSLCEYLYDLCTVFTEFYEVCYCVQKDRQTGEVVAINEWRVVLAEASAQVLRSGFEVLGLRTVTRM